MLNQPNHIILWHSVTCEPRNIDHNREMLRIAVSKKNSICNVLSEGMKQHRVIIFRHRLKILALVMNRYYAIIKSLLEQCKAVWVSLDKAKRKSSSSIVIHCLGELRACKDASSSCL